MYGSPDTILSNSPGNDLQLYVFAIIVVIVLIIKIINTLK